MKIDFHVHQPARREDGTYPFSAAEYVAYMNELSIDISVIFTIDGFWQNAKACNDYLADWCSPFPDRFVPFCTVDPRRKGAADEVYRCVTELGMRGVKLHNWLQGFSPLESFMAPVCEIASELGIPILFHDGTPPYASSLQIAELAVRHPKLKVLLGHAGLHDLWPEAIAAGKRHRNVYLCMCSTPPFAMEQIVAEVPLTQIVFGTDGGLFHKPQQPYVDYRFREFDLLDIPEEAKSQILGPNALRLLGMDKKETTQ
ncbi:amidohydrolase family protein [Paenibacillus sp. V4I5]|uniref:amidohydrolase family protein n=1 Tax=Paenibacillus sp. V4I5 TaxID=3042306 RepID=UPI00279382E9|nr:amidohydrolase family protein [Paenibacillus sp. V4I5]MDQ0920250.1 putative TIM-barrel fold metal-dependent hydrolase [Paenibacillus sp. V4I5]